MEMKELAANLAELNKQIDNLRKEMSEKSQGYLEDAVKQFITKYPFIEGVFWTQFTPHFNDGEDCEFSVNDAYYLIKDDEDACDYEGSVIPTESDFEYLAEQRATTEEYNKDPAAWVEARRQEAIAKYPNRFQTPYYSRKPYYTLDEIERREANLKETLALIGDVNIEDFNGDWDSIRLMIASVDEDIMEMIYGDHARVSITLNGTEIDEYEHD